MLNNLVATLPDSPQAKEKDSPLLATIMNRGNFSIQTLVLKPENEHELEQFVSEKVVPLYRTVFGGNPWHEYLRCNNSKCKKKQSIQSVYGQSKDSLTNLELNFDLKTACCPDCGNAMSFYYPPERKIQETLAELKKSFTTSFLYDGEELVGFCWLWLSTFDAIWEEKFSTISDQFSYAQYVEAIKKYFGDNTNWSMPILYFADICTAPTHRSVDNFYSLMKASLTQSSAKIAEDISIIGYNIQDETAYKLSVPGGIEPICKIPGVESSIVCLPSLKRVINELFNRSLSPRQILREQRKKRTV